MLAIVKAFAEEKSLVIIAATPSAIKYAGLEYLTAMVKTAEKLAPAPMALHLDHGKDVETVSKCTDAGFNSVMIDGSHLNFDDERNMLRS